MPKRNLFLTLSTATDVVLQQAAYLQNSAGAVPHRALWPQNLTD